MQKGVLDLGDLDVERGGTIRGARLAWQIHGTLNAAGDNAIVYPCSYGATHDDLTWLIGPDGVLDPERWFIVIPDMFSNGVSSSAADDPDFPAVVTMADNVRAQHRLLVEHLGVRRIAAAYGFSMGAGQAYHWASMHPELVERAIVVCGSARTSRHNRVMLSGLLSILEASPEHTGCGRFRTQPTAALRALGTVWAGWGQSQRFFREELDRTVLGHPDVDSFIEEDWVEGFLETPGENVYAQARTWQEADISAGGFDGDLPAALAAIEARVLLMPGSTDLYFRVADNAAELPHLRHGELAPIESAWGHQAGSPEQIPEDLAFLKERVRGFLER